jgi:hypothetical protein
VRPKLAKPVKHLLGFAIGTRVDNDESEGSAIQASRLARFRHVTRPVPRADHDRSAQSIHPTIMAQDYGS